ncbi:biotin/lipoyl-containing protein [Micromonospora arborensis]|uniref:acetyl-CoA carboxylase biotin carboxyl carrier protein n=1 Tax=Micromonospora arborensis TaxID=2116518 RepID=UPI0033E2D1D4
MTSRTIIDEIFERAAVLALETRRPPSRIKVQAGDVTVELEWPGPGAHGQSVEFVSAPAEPVDPDTTDSADGLVRICAPLVGTFYHAPGPGEAPFVRPGDLVEPGQQVGILEAMKLMNAVEAEHGGRIVEVLVADKTAVEYGQPLIAFTPTGT